ncbi:hypothetical protein FB99_03480 [Pantoea agglomerans]|nr:hypothetical protein FB99_03480 [Pantoea agglomerans]
MIICTITARTLNDDGAFTFRMRKFCEEHGKSPVAWLA